MNSNHIVAGRFDGPLTPNPCEVAITGAGTIFIASGLQGFDVSTKTGDPGSLTINNVLAGVGTLTAEGNGQLSLNAINIYTGGTQLGYAGSQSFAGIINFNSSASFGAGGIVLSNCLGGALSVEGTNAVTITNAFTVGQTNQSLNLVGNPAGLTFSGPWNLNGFTPALGSGGSGNLVIISGVISGSGGLNYSISANPGTLELTATNTYTGATTITNGTLLVNGSLASLKNVTVAAGATLGGSGAINGSVTVSAGGSLAPGGVNNIGTLTVAARGNSLTLNGGLLFFDLNSPSNCDNIAIGGTGALVLNGANVYPALFPQRHDRVRRLHADDLRVQVWFRHAHPSQWFDDHGKLHAHSGRDERYSERERQFARRVDVERQCLGRMGHFHHQLG